MNIIDDPYIKKVYRRNFKIHISTLMHLLRNSKATKLYCLYLNLHSLYNKKVILDYKSPEKQRLLMKETGLSKIILNKRIEELIFMGILFCKENKHLHIGSPERYMEYSQLTDDYHRKNNDAQALGKDAMKIYQTKFHRYRQRKPITIYDLQLIGIELKLKQKRYKYVVKFFGGREALRKILKKRDFKANLDLLSSLKKQCANDANATKLLNLCLLEISDLFGLDTIQGASKRLAVLESKGALKIKQQIKFLGNIKAGYIKPVGNKYWIKNDWVLKQEPNKLVFTKPNFKKNVWENVLEEHFEQEQKIKTEKIKAKKEVNYNNDLLNTFLSNPLKYSKTEHLETFTDRTTGEIVFENRFYLFRDLSFTGYKYHKIYLNKYQKLDLKSYKKHKYQINKNDIQNEYKKNFNLAMILKDKGYIM